MIKTPTRCLGVEPSSPPAPGCSSSTPPPTATKANGKPPERFDIRRDATRQLGFGQGTHACAGQGLARLEMTAMVRVLAQRVQHIELTGPPTWAVNNIIRRHDRLPIMLFVV